MSFDTSLCDISVPSMLSYLGEASIVKIAEQKF